MISVYPIILTSVRTENPNSCTPRIGGRGAIASVSPHNTDRTPHKASFIAEYTECKPDTSNTIAAHSICTTEYTECKPAHRNAIADIVNVTAEHIEFTDYTSNVKRNNPSVTIAHPNSGSPRIGGWGAIVFYSSSSADSPIAF